MNKATIRAQLLNHRKQLDDVYIRSISKKIVSQVIASNLYQKSQNIALYLPINGEVDLTALLKDKAKSFFIPAIKSKDMQFHQFVSNNELEVHQFGLKQPQYIKKLSAPIIDLCLVPGLGFDLSGNRIGMGGGFYDRYFAENEHTLLAGVAYDFQMIDQLPADPWDVKLHYIFTEHKQHTL